MALDDLGRLLGQSLEPRVGDGDGQRVDPHRAAWGDNNHGNDSLKMIIFLMTLKKKSSTSKG